MGWVSIVSGYINIEGDVRAAIERIEALPTVDRDEWPFLPREVFGLELAKTAVRSGDLPISYKGECIISFGMSVKGADGEWSEWLTKFENLFQSMDASAAFVTLKLTNGMSTDDFDGCFFYKWTRDYTCGDPTARIWTFSGATRSFS
jgi:hypothetical protein